jgi:hypothetical protein
VLAGSHQHYPPAFARVVVAGSELAYEQQRGADVLVEEVVDLARGQLVKSPVAAAGVVDDEDVERPERVGGGSDHAFRGFGVGEVRLEEGHGQLLGDRLGTSRFGAPTLRRIVRSPAMDEDGRPRIEQPPRDRVTDRGTTADTGNQRIAACQVNERDPTSAPRQVASSGWSDPGVYSPPDGLLADA